MLAIDVRDSDLVLAMPHRDGGVARMLVALEDAGLGVSRIEPRMGEAGMYRLTVKGSAEIAVTILEGIGCRVTSSPYPPAQETTTPDSMEVADPRHTSVA